MTRRDVIKRMKINIIILIEYHDHYKEIYNEVQCFEVIGCKHCSISFDKIIVKGHFSMDGKNE